MENMKFNIGNIKTGFATERSFEVGDFLFDSGGNKWEVVEVTDPENDVGNHDAPMIHHAVLLQKKKLNVLANKEE